LLADLGRLDPVRRKMLEDMGIDVWLLREAPVRSAASETPPEPSVEVIEVAEAIAAPPAQPLSPHQPEPSAAPAAPAAPARIQTGQSEQPVQEESPGGSLSVTCFVSEFVVMLIDNAEPGVSRRLCADLLAAVTGNWSTGPNAARTSQIPFTWPAGRARAEGWRAFNAFADRQLGETEVRVVMCSAELADRLPELPTGCRMLVLPEFSELGVDTKRSLWRRIQALDA
jgi:hypothetical protein